MNFLKIYEQSLKLAHYNLDMTAQWVNHFNLTLHQTKDCAEKMAKLQNKRLEVISNNPAATSSSFIEYAIDYAERRILFWDALRKRGNQYIEHIAAGSPPVLIFNYEIIVDGRKLEHPVNYALVEIVPPEGVKIDPKKRPFLIIDPRSGHGAGIGGFKDDSQVGVALRAGHPVYFVIFFPNPEPNQTLRDIAIAEKIFTDAVKARHPHSPKPCIIGNCQAGWAVMMLAAAAPDLAGGLVINGAPLSYWEGENGKNPIRYLGGLSGGSWLVQLASDLGNGKFDGANLVVNFERLEPANTYWTKYYHLFSNIDSEEERFLAFERWWGGFYLMNAAEIRSIVDNFFIGNYLTHGKIPIDRSNNVDLRKIHSPIIIFCSEGDNVASPKQALTWITDIYDNELEIKQAEQTIIYLVHEDIGHLGIFVSAKVATKEHKEIFDVLDYVEILPPGLYEMVINEEQDKHGKTHYNVIFEERTIKNIVDQYSIKHHNNRNVFRTVRLVSKYNVQTYDMFLSPWIKLFTNEASAELLRQLNPLRMHRYMISDYNPFFAGLSFWAEQVRAHRHQASKNNPFIELQAEYSKVMEALLNNYRDNRDSLAEITFYSVYEFLAIIFSDLLQRERHKREIKLEDNSKHSAQNIDLALAQGGPVDAIIRIILLIVKAQGFMQGSRVANFRELLKENLDLKKEDAKLIGEKIRIQSYLVAHDADKAIVTLLQLLPTAKDRQFVLAVLRKIIETLPLLSPEAEKMWEHIQKILGE